MTINDYIRSFDFAKEYKDGSVYGTDLEGENANYIEGRVTSMTETTVTFSVTRHIAGGENITEEGKTKGWTEMTTPLVTRGKSRLAYGGIEIINGTPPTTNEELCPCDRCNKITNVWAAVWIDDGNDTMVCEECSNNQSETKAIAARDSLPHSVIDCATGTIIHNAGGDASMPRAEALRLAGSLDCEIVCAAEDAIWIRYSTPGHRKVQTTTTPQENS